MLGLVPAEATSNQSPPNDRKRPSAIWLRAEFPVQRMIPVSSSRFETELHVILLDSGPPNSFQLIVAVGVDTKDTM